MLCLCLIEETFLFKNYGNFFISFNSLGLSASPGIKLCETDIGSVVVWIFSDKFLELLYFRYSLFAFEKKFAVSIT